MPTVTTTGAGAIGAFGVIRNNDKNVAVLTNTEIIYNYILQEEIFASLVKLYSEKTFSNDLNGAICYYDYSLTNPVVSVIFKTKGKYYFANSSGVIEELLATPGWTRLRYTANWVGVDFDNPYWLGEAYDNLDWEPGVIINNEWPGVLTNTNDWPGELKLTPGWQGELTLTPNWSGVPIYDEEGVIIGYDNSDPNTDNGGKYYDFSNPNTDNGGKYYDIYAEPALSNGGKYYDIYAERTVGNEGYIEDNVRTATNGGILFDLTAERTLGNEGLIHSVDGVHRTIENDGLFYATRTIENGAFTSIWTSWATNNSTIYTRSSKLVGSIAYSSKNKSSTIVNQDIAVPAAYINKLYVASSGVVYYKVGESGNFVFDGVSEIVGQYALSRTSGRIKLGDKLYQLANPMEPFSNSVIIQFFQGERFDLNNSGNGSYERYYTNSAGIVTAASRFDGEYWLTFPNFDKTVLAGASSYTVELFIKPAPANAGNLSFSIPYNPNWAVFAQYGTGIVGMSNGSGTQDKWLLSVYPYLTNSSDVNINSFQFDAFAGGNFIQFTPITYGNYLGSAGQSKPWQHVAITYSQNTNKICVFLNGLLVGEAQRHTPSYNITSLFSVGLREADYNGTLSGIFNGRIADLRVVSKNIYQSGETARTITVPTMPLTNYGYGGVNQGITSDDVELLAFPSGIVSNANNATINELRPRIESVRIAGVTPTKVIIEFRAVNRGIISTKNLVWQQNILNTETGALSLVGSGIFDAGVIYDRNDSLTTIELPTAANRVYHFSIVLKNHAGTAYSDIYRFKT